MKSLFTKLIFGISLILGMSACQNDLDNDPIFDSNNSADSTRPGHAEGYFTATFFPQQAGTIMSRADGYDIIEPSDEEVEGNSKAIQDLICLIYQKDENSEDYILFAEKQVITYEAQGAKIQQYEWPLKNEISFVLPNGDYKAVFVGNATIDLYTETVTNEILTGVKKESIGTANPSKFSDARLNMPIGQTGQPIMFEDVDGEVTDLDGKTEHRDVHNMLYLCTVDFNEYNFDGTKEPPYVLMQRVVSQNYYGRDFINEKDMLEKLVANIVESTVKAQLLSETTKGLLKSKLIVSLNNVVNGLVNSLCDELGGASLRIGFLDVPVGYIVEPLVRVALTNLLNENGLIWQLVNGLADGLVDPLLSELTGALLTKANEELLSPITQILHKTLNGQNGSLLGLDALLNPWAHVNAVDIEYQSLTKSIGFDREVKQYFTQDDDGAKFYKVPVIRKNIPFDQAVDEDNEPYYALVTTLSGKVSDDNNQIKQHLLSKIDVNAESADKDLLGLVGLLVDDVDKLVGGLLVNIEKKLYYSMESNLQYSTRCNLLNLDLFDHSPDGETVTITINLGDVLPEELINTLVGNLLGDGQPLTEIIKAITEVLGGLVGTVTDALYFLTGGLVDLSSITTPIINFVNNLIIQLTGDGYGRSGLIEELAKNLSLEFVGLQLPALGITNINIEGSWDVTSVSNGSIIPPSVLENF